jgi:hypothetical protein
MLMDWVREHEGPAATATIEAYVNQDAYLAVFEQEPALRSRYNGWVMSVVWENGPRHSDLFIQHAGKLICLESLPIYAARW